MTDITPIDGPTRTARVQGESRAAARGESRATRPARGEDAVEVSAASSLLGRLKTGVPVREDLVAQIRGQSDDGTYETAEKLEQAVDEILRDEHELG